MAKNGNLLVAGDSRGGEPLRKINTKEMMEGDGRGEHGGKKL